MTASARIGGAETSLLRLIEAMHGKGVAVTAGVLCLENQGPLADRLRAMCIEVLCMAVGPYQSIGPVAQRRVRKALQAFRPHVVQIFGLRAEVAARRPAKTLPGSPRVISSIRSPDPWRRRHHVWLDRASARWVDRFVSNSLIGKWSRVVREGFDPGRISVIYNGVAPPPSYTAEQIAATRHRFGLESNAGPVVIVPANLRPMKGHEAVIRAAVRLKDWNPRLRIVCAGRDDSGGVIPAMAARAGVADLVRFAGFVEDMSALLAAADYVLLPSAWEGCPTSILEAQVMGKVVIANNAGGIPELVEHGRTGWLLHADRAMPDLRSMQVEPPPSVQAVRRATPDWQDYLAPRPVDPIEIVAALEHLENNAPLRTDLRRTACRRALDEFSLDQMVNRHLELYTRI
ncbi:MAG: hypothetical protein Kow0059_08500 [Candidatus Sumerlaeia bacterium]